jgi:hypothetical protein
MKSLLYVIFAGLCSLSALQGAMDLEAIKSKVDSAQGAEEKAQALYDLAEAYSSSGDHARSLNQLEKVQTFIYEVKSMDLVNKIENLYWKSFNAFNVLNPRQAFFDAEQKRLGEERIKNEEKARLDRLKALRDMNKKPFLSTEVDAYKKSLSRGRPRFRRRLSPLSMGHLNGLNTVVGVPELDSAYLLPMKVNWSLDYRLDMGFYQEKSTDGFSQLDVDSNITRGLFEITLPYKTFRSWRLRRRSFDKEARRVDFKIPNRPFDLRIGVPVVRWSSKPNFVYDRTSPATSTLMDGSNGSYGPGDAFVELKTAFISTLQSAFGMKLRIKLPTGYKKELGGTGSVDTSLAALYSSSLGAHHFNMNLGYVMVGDSKNFEGGSVDLSDVLFFGSDFAFNLINDHYLLASFDYHQNAFRGYTSIPVLDDPPMSVGFGYSTQLYNDRLYFGIKTGLNGASADQSFMITYRRLR